MATTTLRTAAADTANGNTYATGAFTPPVGDLIVVACLATGSLDSGGTGHTVTDNRTGGTYTMIDSANKGSGSDQLTFFVRNALVTFSGTHTITLNCGGDNATGAVVGSWTINGVTRSGISAIRQATTPRSNQTAGTSPVLTFATNTLTGNVLLAALVNATNPATVSAPGSWTEDADTGYATPTAGMWMGHRDSGATSTTFTIGSSGSQWGAMGVEIDTSANTTDIPATTVTGAVAIGSHTTFAEVTAAVTGTTVAGAVAIGAHTVAATDGSVITNLIPNPAAVGAAGYLWSEVGTGGSGSHSIGDAHLGSEYWESEMESTDISNNSFLVHSGTPGSSTSYAVVSSSQTYNASIYFKTAVHTGTVGIHIFWYTSGGAFAGLSSGGTVTSTSSYQRLSMSATSPGTAAYALVTLTSSQYRDTDLFKVDSAQLTEGATLYDYFDGDTTDGGGYTYAWTGTPHRSTSTRSVGSGDAAISAATVAGVVTFGVGTKTAGAAHAATTVAGAVAIGAHTVSSSSGAAISATTVSRTVAFGSITGFAGTQAAITAVNVAGVATVPTATKVAGAAHAATTVSRTVAIGPHTIAGTSGTTVTAVNVAGTVAVGVHTPRAFAAHTATTVSRTVAIGAHTVAATSGAAVSAATISRAVTISGSAAAGGSVGISATTVAGVVTIPGSSQVANATHAATTVAGSVAVGAASVTIGAANAPATVTGAASVSGTASASISYTATTITVTSAVGVPVISAPQNYNATPATISRTVVISGAVTVAAQPATISRTVTISGTARIGYQALPATVMVLATVTSGGALWTPAGRDMVVTGTLRRSNYSGVLRRPNYSGRLRSKEDASA